MKQRPTSWVKFSAYLAFATMILATLGLIYLALAHLPRQRFILESERQDKAFRVLQKFAGELEKAIDEETRRLLACVNPNDLASFKSRQFTDTFFFLLDHNFKIVVPEIRQHYSHWKEPVVQESEIAVRFFREGQKYEFGTPPQYNEAVKFYQLALQSFTHPAWETKALLALSWCYFQQQNYIQSVEEAQRVLQKAGENTINPYLSLLARYYCGQALLGAGSSEAWDVLLELYEAVFTMKITMERHSQYLYWKEKLHQLLENNKASLQHEQKLRFGRLSLQNHRLELQAQMHQFLQTQGVPAIRTQIPSPTTAAHYWYGVDFAYGLIGYSFNLNGSIYGFCSSLESWLPKLEPVLLRSTDFFLALSRGDQVLWSGGLHNREPLMVYELRVWPGFKLEAYPRDPDQLESKIQQEIFFTLFITVLISGSLFAGVYVSLHSFNREVELSRLKSDFVDCISHELRTPLALIKSHIETLYLGRVRESKKQHYYQVILRASERLTRLIQNLLNLSQIERGKLALTRERVDIALLLENFCAEQALHWPGHQGKIRLQLKEHLPPIIMDQTMIHSALFNLLDNAVKYSEKDQDIILGAGKVADQLCLWVQDYGRGIKPEEQKKIFEKFHRLDQDVRGTGLGLTMVDYIAKAHCGYVKVQSSPGKGSLFQLWIPWSKDNEA